MINESISANHTGTKKKVVIVALTGQMLIDFAGPSDVFTNADKYLLELGNKGGYDISVVAPTRDRKIRTTTGMEISFQTCAMDIDTLIDTLIVAGEDHLEPVASDLEPFYQWLAGKNEHNTRRIASVCIGAFALAKVGLLDGRKATTHWSMRDQLKKEYPQIEVDPDAFFTRDRNVYCSAGVSSGIDLALSLVEEDFGWDVASRVARQLVFYLNRPGSQAQFGNLLPAYEGANIGKKLQDWLEEHLHEPIDVGRMADHFNMSVRNLTRVVQKQTGMPPAKFIEKMRVEKARRYLEDTDMPLERIAEHCGLGNLVSMRRMFLRHLMTTPSDYRRVFRTTLNRSNQY